MTRMNQLNLAEEEAAKIKEEILHKEGENLRKKRKKISIFDFEPLKIIGKGAFGEVRVCRYIPNNSIVAVKKMKKEEMHKKKPSTPRTCRKRCFIRGKKRMDCRFKIQFSRPKLFIFRDGIFTRR